MSEKIMSNLNGYEIVDANGRSRIADKATFEKNILKLWKSATAEGEEDKLLFSVGIANEIYHASVEEVDINVLSLWTQGHFKSTDGTIGTTGSTYYLRSVRTIDYLPVNVIKVEGTYPNRWFSVFVYDLEGNYLETILDVYDYARFDFTTKRYMLQLRENPITKLGNSITPEDIYADYKIITSQFNQNQKTYCDFGNMPSAGYYNGLSEGYADFTKDTTYSEYLEKLDSLVANASDYVTKSAIGEACDGQTIYLYDLKMPYIKLPKLNKKKPKILITAGVHGTEKSNVFGLYYFINDLINHWSENPILEYIRNNVELRIIPIVNTYGFDNWKYKNINLVNINRNFATENWEFYEDTTSSNYTGLEPFDQPEACVIRDFILQNLDAFFYFDSHTNGQGIVASYSDMNSMNAADNETNTIVWNAAEFHLRNITEHFKKDYDLAMPDDDNLCGRIYPTTNVGSIKEWANEQGIAAIALEGFNGFPNDTTAHNPDTIKANAEIIGNWIFTVLHYFS